MEHWSDHIDFLCDGSKQQMHGINQKFKTNMHIFEFDFAISAEHFPRQ